MMQHCLACCMVVLSWVPIPSALLGRDASGQDRLEQDLLSGEASDVVCDAAVSFAANRVFDMHKFVGDPWMSRSLDKACGDLPPWTLYDKAMSCYTRRDWLLYEVNFNVGAYAAWMSSLYPEIGVKLSEFLVAESPCLRKVYLCAPPQRWCAVERVATAVFWQHVIRIFPDSSRLLLDCPCPPLDFTSAHVVDVRPFAEMPKPPPRRQRVAVCITGAMRSLTDSDVHQSIRRFVDGLGVDPFFFFVVNKLNHYNFARRKSKRCELALARGELVVNNSDADLADVFRSLPPTYIEFENSTGDASRRRAYTARCADNWPPNCAAQFAGIAGCVGAVENHEGDTGPMDWILRLRTDMHFPPETKWFPTIDSFDSAYAHIPLHPAGEFMDHFALLPRKYASTYARALDFNAGRCFSKGDMEELHCQTDGCICMLTRHLAAARVPVRAIPTWYQIRKFVYKSGELDVNSG